MAAGGGRPRWGVDICWVLEELARGSGENAGPTVVNTGEKREVDGGVGGE